MRRRAPAAAVAILCRPDGGVIEFLYDGLDLASVLPPGIFLTTVVTKDDVPKAVRFLRAIRERQSAAGHKMEVALPDGALPLHFVGYQVERGIVVLAGTEPLPCDEFFRRLTQAHASPAAAMQPPTDRPGGVPADRSARLAAAAHYLRNRLNGIMASAEYLLEDAADSLQHEQKMLLESIDSSSRSMFRMVDDLLELVAIESGTTRLEPQLTDIVALVKSVLLSCRNSAERKKVRLDVASGRTLPPVTVNPVRIARIVDNLLANSIEASRSGSGVQIRVEVRDRSAVVAAEVRNPALSVEEARRLFYPAHGAARERAHSGPVGALIVQQILEEMGGSLQVYAGPGAGLTFTVEVPIPNSRPLRAGGRSH
jgi:signal transduction histidine kinase